MWDSRRGTAALGCPSGVCAVLAISIPSETRDLGFRLPLKTTQLVEIVKFTVMFACVSTAS